MSWDEKDPWSAGDGTVWLQTGPEEWTGWEPNCDGYWIRHEREFRKSYPDAP